MNSELDKIKLLEHYGHELIIAKYGEEGSEVNIALECVACNEVLADSNL